MIQDPDHPHVYVLEEGEAAARVAAILAETPYSSVGELRDAVRAEQCCYGCHDYNHEHAHHWQRLEPWLDFAGIDWRTAP